METFRRYYNYTTLVGFYFYFF